MAIYFTTTKKQKDRLESAIGDITGFMPFVFKEGKEYRIQENEHGQTQMDLKLFAKKILRLDELCEDAKAEVHSQIFRTDRCSFCFDTGIVTTTLGEERCECSKGQALESDDPMSLIDYLKYYLERNYDNTTPAQIEAAAKGIEYYLTNTLIPETLTLFTGEANTKMFAWAVYLEDLHGNVLDETEVEAYSQQEAETLGDTVFKESEFPDGYPEGYTVSAYVQK